MQHRLILLSSANKTIAKLMDLNKFSFYRANPFANNDFIPTASMNNRKRKQFASEIPQGQDYLPSKPGKRIYKEKIDTNQIQKDSILNSPERYPYENRIALDKSFPRNLNTIDIEGASSGTKVSESIRNKHKALEELRRRNQQEIKSPIAGESLDEVYQKKRRELAETIKKNNEMRRTKENFTQSQSNSETPNYYSIPRQTGSKLNQKELQQEYERYVQHNSNQKYNPKVPNSYEFEGFQRYKRPQNLAQTLDSYNNRRIPEQIPMNRGMSERVRYHSIDSDHPSNSMHNSTNYRGRSIQDSGPNSPLVQSSSFKNNSLININNRHRSNPEYIDNYTMELQKRMAQAERNKQVEENIKNVYQSDRAQFRRHNPTNLSFNIAAKSTLMGPIV